MVVARMGMRGAKAQATIARGLEAVAIQAVLGVAVAADTAVTVAIGEVAVAGEVKAANTSLPLKSREQNKMPIWRAWHGQRG